MGTKLDAPMVVQRVCKRSMVKDLLCGVVDGIIGAPRCRMACFPVCFS